MGLKKLSSIGFGAAALLLIGCGDSGAPSARDGRNGNFAC